MIERIDLLEDIGQFRIILLKFHHLCLKFSISYLDLREKGKLNIINLSAQFLYLLLSIRYLRTQFYQFHMHILLECIVLLIFDDDLIVLFLLFLNDEIDVEVLVLDVLRKHLHLCVALRCLF